MKVVVIGGSGLIGSKVVELLNGKGHTAMAASPTKGVNTITKQGLTEALERAQVVVDVANAPSFDGDAAMAFFQTSSRNLLAAEVSAGVGHHVVLSIVGTARLRDSGYYRAKLAQENIIKSSSIPYTIVQSTQFFEFMGVIARTSADENTVRLSPARVQPIAADDIAAVLTELALDSPRNAVVEVAGPEAGPLDVFARTLLVATGDTRHVIADPSARYFGAELDDQSLTPGDNPVLGTTRFAKWLDSRDALRTKP